MELIRSRKVKLSLDLAPLIDVVFQLLIFFMLTAAFTSPTIKLNLPRAVTQDPRQSETIIISVEKDGKIFLNNVGVPLEALKADLQAVLAAHPAKSIFIKGDENMAYKYFVQILDTARQAGATQINIVHQGNP